MSEVGFQQKIKQKVRLLPEGKGQLDGWVNVILFDDVLEAYAEDQKTHKQKLQAFYDNLKGNIEVDEKSGYHVSKEKKELLQIVEELLRE